MTEVHELHKRRRADAIALAELTRTGVALVKLSGKSEING